MHRTRLGGRIVSLTRKLEELLPILLPTGIVRVVRPSVMTTKAHRSSD
jgi:hypothetical protein